MRPRKYPLDPLARLRGKEVDSATKLLSDAIRARQEAQRAEDAALARTESAAAESRAVTTGEDAALARGELRAADLVQGAAWRARDEIDRAELARGLMQAGKGTLLAHAEEKTAQTRIARARAEAEVVARDRARWEAEGRKKGEAAEEEAVAEAFKGKPT
jgi:hypothetical protein